MRALTLHLVAVHVPVVGLPIALLVFGASLLRRETAAREALFQTACALCMIAAAFAILAYFTGPPALESLESLESKAPGSAGIDDEGDDLVTDHALLGRAGFVGAVLLGVVAARVLVGYAQDETPGRWLRGVLIVATLALCHLFAWTAHLGGAIRRPELRGTLRWLFPEIS